MTKKKLLFLLLPLIVCGAVIIGAEWISRTQYYSQHATVTLNLTWFECGLLYKYSIDNFIDVLDQFNFNGVMIQPFMLEANSTTVDSTAQTRICEGFHSLCNRVDAYAEANEGFRKFLFVSGKSHLDKMLAESFVNRSYVMCIDDGSINLTVLRVI